MACKADVSGEDLRLGTAISMSCLLALLACGGGGGGATSGPLTGNWEITLQRHGLPQPATYTGFLIQNGSSITGSVILGDACSGVGSVTGTVNGQNLTLDINEFGQDVSLIGSMPAGSGPIGGQFSTPAGACTAPYTSTGTWSAVPVPPLNGNFTGVFSSTADNGPPPVNVTGTVTQGPNTGASNATLSGTITATSAASSFCSYLTTATITGTISGEVVTLNLYGPDGALISQISAATITPDGTSLTGEYTFQQISKSCLGDQGTLQLTFQ